MFRADDDVDVDSNVYLFGINFTIKRRFFHSCHKSEDNYKFYGLKYILSAAKIIIIIKS